MIIGTSLMFVGCSAKTPPPSTKVYDKEGGYSMAIFAKTPSPGFFDSKATWLNNTIIYTLQVAAEETKKDGKEYFGIVYPLPISVLQGSIMNTADEYIKKRATNNPFKGILILEDPFKILKGSLNNPVGGEMVIVGFDKKVDRYVLYSASDPSCDRGSKLDAKKYR